MSLQMVSCEDQYKLDTRLNRIDVLKLQQWQQSQPHLPNITENEAIIFVHACEYDLEKAKTCVDLYYTIRTIWTELFSNRDVFGADVEAQLRVSGAIVLPGLTKEGNRVILFSMTDPDPSKFNHIDNCKLFNMMIDYLLVKAGICEGYTMVCDMKGQTWGHMAQVNIFVMRKFMYYIQEALPIRLKGAHYINASAILDKMMSMMKPFIKKELLSIIHVHKTLDTFLDVCVPKAMMPNEYGGSAGKKLDMIESFNNEMKANSAYFIEEEATKRVNEDLRPGKPKTERDVFGYFCSLFSSSKKNAVKAH